MREVASVTGGAGAAPQRRRRTRAAAARPHFSGCDDPRVLTRRQRRQLRWYGTLLGEEEQALEAKAQAMSQADGERWLQQAVSTVMRRLRDGSLDHLLERDEL